MKPTFSKAGVATFTFDEGVEFPIGRSDVPNQSIGIAVGGAIQVKTYSSTIEQVHTMTFRLNSLDSYDDLYDFFNDSNVNWRANSFTFTDSDGNIYTVRLWQDGIGYTWIAENIYIVSLILRVEP